MPTSFFIRKIIGRYSKWNMIKIWVKKRKYTKETIRHFLHRYIASLVKWTTAIHRFLTKSNLFKSIFPVNILFYNGNMYYLYYSNTDVKTVKQMCLEVMFLICVKLAWIHVSAEMTAAINKWEDVKPPLSDCVLDGIKKLGFTKMTPVQV